MNKKLETLLETSINYMSAQISPRRGGQWKSHLRSHFFSISLLIFKFRGKRHQKGEFGKISPEMGGGKNLKKNCSNEHSFNRFKIIP